ncbi:MAG: hypothetical protein LRZ84_05470 [Desertifilum sp.]|nr:hypothetical protein [Desertifilum sp.]
MIVNQALANPNPIVIASDSKLEILALAEKLRRNGETGVQTLTSDDAGQPWVRQFLEDPAGYIRSRGITKFLYTPTGQDGLDFSGLEGYFSDGYFLFFGVVTTNAQTQMLERVRDDSMQRHVFCVPVGMKGEQTSRSFFSERVAKATLSYQLESSSLLGIGDAQHNIQSLIEQIIAASTDAHFRYECELIALDNMERANLRECLCEALSGKYDIEKISGKHGNTQEIKAIKEEIKLALSEAIFEAPTLTAQEASDLASEYATTQGDRAGIAKRRLLDRLPGIELTPQWHPTTIKLILFDERGLLSQLESQFLLAHPEIARQLDSKRWRKRLERFIDPETPDEEKKVRLARARSRLAKVKALEEIGISYFLQPGQTWSATTPELLDLWTQSKSARIGRALGIQVGKSDPVRWLNRLLRSLSLEICSTGKTHRVYSLKPLSPMKQTLLNCIAHRFESLSQETLNFEDIQIPKPITQQALESQAHSPLNLTKLEPECAPVQLESNNNPNQPDNVDPDGIQWLAKEYLPLVAQEEESVARELVRGLIAALSDQWRSLFKMATREVQLHLGAFIDPDWCIPNGSSVRDPVQFGERTTSL